MPKPLADFLNEHVYGGHFQTDPCRPADPWHSVLWIYVYGEQAKHGTSLANHKEAEAIRNIIRGRRLKPKKFVAITPYDAQRQTLSQMLTDCGGKHRCFNVDTFQGHEAEIVLASAVRSTEGMGFLGSSEGRKRTNVMLSRAQKELIVVGNINYLLRVGKGTLLGEFARWCDSEGRVMNVWQYLKKLKSGELGG